jgi:two-component sensor histidine kinase
MKYAFTDLDKGQILISAEKNGSEVTVIYHDNGSGLPESFSLEKSRGFGMQMISLLVKQIGGYIEVERSPGAGFIISFEP